MKNHDHDLLDRGLARLYRGRLIPVIRGGSGEDEPLFPAVPDDLAALSDEDLQAFIDASASAVEAVTSDPAAHVTADLSAESLFEQTSAAMESLDAARSALASRGDDDESADEAETADEPEVEPESADEPAAEAAVADDLAAEFAELGARARPEAPETSAEPIVAAAATPRPGAGLARPARGVRSAPVDDRVQAVALTASAPNLGFDVGEAIPNDAALADMMMKRRRQFGDIPAGTMEPVPIARADWRSRYPEDRTLQAAGGNLADLDIVRKATDPNLIKRELERRRTTALTASGGLCAPVTPYYGLQLLSGTARPVRGALPAFNADRGGLRYARPASISSINVDEGIGVRTAAEDAAGGTFAQKSCQTVDCPDFTETDVRIIYHCAKYGNLLGRTFPELVTNWNALTMAGHARLAESELLTDIDHASTAVTADALGLGATASYPSQLLALRAGFISRHRMDPDSVFRALIPFWVLDVLVSDVYRSQFQRFDMTKASFVALLRANGIEPSFYIDSALGKGQVIDDQSAGALLGFPGTAYSYVYPEGSFLFLDGGTLELGLVRDSVLNSTNDYEIFGESFEAAAFIGVESIALASELCDNGAVTAPATAPDCPINYAG